VTNWRTDHLRGSAADLFTGPQSSASLLASGPIEATIRFVEVDRPTLVLGSAQPPSIVGAVPNVVTRRSGGGAVWLDPTEQIWVDVMVPVGHRLFSPDVRESFTWLGQAWAAAIRELGVTGDIAVHDGPMEGSTWSGLVCFAGRGPGEVFVGGRKLVGISQRRSRFGALFQCGLLLRWTFAPSWFDERARPADIDDSVLLAGVGLSELGVSRARWEIEAAVLRAFERASIGLDG
jgi:lipoate---protein ligase